MRYLFILALAVLLAACEEPAPVTNLDVTITGAEPDAQLLVKGPDYVKEIDLTEGKVQDTLMITQEGQYAFSLGWQTLRTYLKPGEAVSITADAEGYSAEGAFADAAQQKVAGYFQSKAALLSESLDMRQLANMELDSFLNALTAGEAKLRTHLGETELPASIAASEEDGIGYQLKIKEILFPLYNRMEEADIPEALRDPLAGIDLNDDAKFLTSPDYEELVNISFTMEMNRDTSSDYVGAFMRRVAAKPAGHIRNALLYDNFRYMMGPNEQLDEHMAFFKEHSSDARHLAKMEEKYQALQDLMPGKPSPSFDYENYVGGNTKLEELRGKYVYVDVWATWCGPCIGEIPSLKAKEEKYHDANVEFVSLSIDDPEDEEKWRGMIENRELGGTQLIADNAWESQFPRDYQINGIPRFILIDPEGKIVSADAPRPSSDDFDELFAEQGLK